MRSGLKEERLKCLRHVIDPCVSIEYQLIVALGTAVVATLDARLTVRPPVLELGCVCFHHPSKPTAPPGAGHLLTQWARLPLIITPAKARGAAGHAAAVGFHSSCHLEPFGGRLAEATKVVEAASSATNHTPAEVAASLDVANAQVVNVDDDMGNPPDPDAEI